MSTVLLRRRRLGMSSGRGIVAKSTTGIRVCRSWRMEQDRPPESGDLVIRWGCTANLMPYAPLNVLNTAQAIHQVNDKAGFRMLLQAADPELVPATWIDTNDVQYPCIIRPSTHSQGRNLHLCTSPYSMHIAIEACAHDWYANEYIQKVAEYRVFVVQGRAVAVAEKTPANREDIAWNVARGGRFDNVAWDNWPLQAVRKSIEAFNLSELDFGGVDVMVDADGKAYVIEINSAPSLTSDYRQECMAKAFDWIVLNGKERIPMIEERGGYRKFIHPCICDRAILVEDMSTFGTDDAAHVAGSGGLADEPFRGDEPIEEVIAAAIGARVVRTVYGELSAFTDQQLLDEMDRRMGR